MNIKNPAESLLEIVDVDRLIIDQAVIDSVKHYVRYNESGLAYDELIFQIKNEFYYPSPKAFKLIKHTAKELGIIYPNLSC
jgi:hypothetical protein